MQDRFAARLFDAAHAMGIHTAIETNGFLGERLSDEELADIDLVLLDMKGFTLEQHKRVAGIANEPVIAFAERLAALAPGAVASVKELVAQAPRRTLVEQLAAERDHFLANLFGADGGEGLRAFVEKRAARFS